MSEMVARHYRIAGVRYIVRCPEAWMYESDYRLQDYRTAPEPWDQEIIFSVEDALPVPAGKPVFEDPGHYIYLLEDGFICYEGGVNAYICSQCRGNRTSVVVRRSSLIGRITVKLVLSAMFLSKMLIHRHGFILHSSYIRYGDQAILFTAPSGTGKSTQADLWVTLRGAELINGDRAAILNTPEGVFVHGIPYCGSSNVSKNVTLPLTAIVYLSQAPATTITRLTGLQCFRSIWEGCTVDLWDREEMTTCTDLVLDVIRKVPVYHLACTPDESAVIAVEREILSLR